MKSNAIIRIVLFSLAILILLGILLGSIAFDTFRTDFESYVDRVGPTENLEQLHMDNFTAGIQNIEIEWVAGSITFQKDPGAIDISVLEYSPVDSEHRMVCKQSGQTLKIKYSEEDFGPISFGVDVDISKDLVITVPANWTCNTLEIDVAASEVVMEDLTIEEFDFDGASGECRMTACDIGELDIDTASGNVHFSGTLNTLDCDAASADCTIELINIPRSIKVDALSGDLDLILPPSAGFTCTLESMSSSFDSDFEFTMRGDEYIHGNGECKIKLSALSGDVSIHKGIE